ncbi:hypothetical protein KDA_53770 [Dictyobacter alpinus]|uniref:Uncharacterized protein n=1 Tax=Dictyobacter alpinus TaxID=2014873 RepID=A0A402BET3_9CHLR|nr:hypothetical protein KDA_53770 [Dictyobacter alpinus]
MGMSRVPSSQKGRARANTKTKKGSSDFSNDALVFTMCLPLSVDFPHRNNKVVFLSSLTKYT